MKFEIKQKDLLGAINIANRAVSKSTNIQIHELIYFSADKDGLSLTSFDGEISIKTYAKANIIEEGVMAVKADLISNIIRKLPDELVKIELENGKINIKCKRSNFNLISFEYFEKEEIRKPDSKPIQIDNDKLKRSINQTEFATSLDETKLALDYPADFENTEYIIPKRSLLEWSRIVSDDSKTSLYKNDNDLMFVSESTTMLCKVIDKNYIDYRNIINDISETSIVLEKRELTSALDRAQVLSDPGRANLIKVSIDEKVMTIMSNSEIGDVKEVIEVEQEGEGLDIAFNAKYMQDGVKACDSEKIKLNFKSSLNPCLIYPTNSSHEGEDFTYLVLPVRLAK